MPLPVPTNTTMDIYRNGRAPPLQAPDVASVPIRLTASYYAGLEHGERDGFQLRPTHAAVLALSVDVRDGYDYGGLDTTANDTVWIPDKNGTPFSVIFVERKRLPGGPDYKRVHLQRQAAPWPTNNL